MKTAIKLLLILTIATELLCMQSRKIADLESKIDDLRRKKIHCSDYCHYYVPVMYYVQRRTNPGCVFSCEDKIDREIRELQDRIKKEKESSSHDTR